MEWSLRSDGPVLAGQVRKEFVDYLVRHGEPGSDLKVAEFAFDELVGNACRHAPGPVWVQVDWTGRQPVLHVRDTGVGFRLVDALSAERRGGLRILSDLCGPVRVHGRREHGTDVSLTLPVRRSAEDRAPRIALPAGRLPDPAQAAPDGTIGRDAYLGALTVELAQVLEVAHGPAAAENAVAAVGTGVGERIEEEYRRARALADRLSPRQVAELFVTLAGAIGGDFSVEHVDEERIVLRNRRCPFGEAVRKAPSLCGMTSSVLGGIAARNAGHGAVTLEQRIAVGDPECRVVVALRRPGSSPDELEAAAPGRAADRVRAVLAEDAAFLRAPLVQVLADAEVDVVAHCESPDRVLGHVRTYQPDVLVMDFGEARTAEALSVAREVRDTMPATGVLVLAEGVAAENARQLLGDGASGVGYLLKSTLEDVDGFVAAVLTVSRGGSAIDPEVVAGIARLDRDNQPLADLTQRELEVLHCLSDGLTNDAVAERLVITKRAVEKHIGNIFLKLDLAPTSEQERRVLAVRAYLRATGVLSA